MDITLSIIIVNYNSRNVLKDCLNSLKEIDVRDYEVIIVDNASDEKIKDLEQSFPGFCFIYNERNLGFAAANNNGIRNSKGKYVLLLNPDTIVNSDSFNPMISYLETNKDVGIVGCKIYNKDGDIERSTHSFPTLVKEFVHANEFIKKLLGYENSLMTSLSRLFSLKSSASYWNHDEIKVVDHVTGACMMLKREVINKAGMLDEAFFLYNEEVEWSLRIKKAGYKSVFLPESSIIHLFGHSTKQKVQQQTANQLLVERYKGMLYFFQKHYGFIQLLLLRIIVFQGFSFRILYDYLKFPFVDSIKQEKLSKELKYYKQIVNLVWLSNYDWRAVT